MGAAYAGLAEIAGVTPKKVPIVFEDRRVGQSKMSRKVFLEALPMVWNLKLAI